MEQFLESLREFIATVTQKETLLVYDASPLHQRPDVYILLSAKELTEQDTNHAYIPFTLHCQCIIADKTFSTLFPLREEILEGLTQQYTYLVTNYQTGSPYYDSQLQRLCLPLEFILTGLEECT